MCQLCVYVQEIGTERWNTSKFLEADVAQIDRVGVNLQSVSLVPVLLLSIKCHGVYGGVFLGMRPQESLEALATWCFLFPRLLP
jgi:hypothetical protein